MLIVPCTKQQVMKILGVLTAYFQISFKNVLNCLIRETQDMQNWCSFKECYIGCCQDKFSNNYARHFGP